MRYYSISYNIAVVSCQKEVSEFYQVPFFVIKDYMKITLIGGSVF